MPEFYWPIRIYYEDTDCGGVVYHANYLRFFERARTEWLRKLGFEQDRLLQQYGVVFAVRSIHIDFLQAAVFNQLLWVSTDLLEIGKASLSITQKLLCIPELRWDAFQDSIARVRIPQEVTPLCSAHVKIACLDQGAFKPRPIPKTIVEEISRARC